MNFYFLKPFNTDISKRILTIAYPIIIANMSRAIMGIIDMIMVGRLGVNSIAAVGFGEMIVFHRLLDHEADPKVRLALLTSKIEDAFATVFRQIVLCQFEQLVHEHRSKTGELETQQINELWMQANRPMHGNTVTLTDNYAIWWSYIPHFIHVPFYTYAYAFGELLVLALYKMYQEEGQAFVPTYLGMLAKGGTASPSQLVSPFGLEIDDPDFWSRGLLLLDDMVTQAVELARLVAPA